MFPLKSVGSVPGSEVREGWKCFRSLRGGREVLPSWKELSSVSGCEGWGGIQALILSLLAGAGSGQGQRAGHSPFLGTRGGSTLPESRAGSGADRTFRETSVSRGETPMAGSHGFV